MFTDNGFNPRPEVRISFNREWEEFTVKTSDSSYHCTDATEAHDQAQYMVRTHGYKLVVSASAKSRIAKVTREV